MLTIKCSACHSKLFKYEKIGHGQVLMCHKARIKKFYKVEVLANGKLCCQCGQEVGIDKGSCFKMINKGFIFSGTKV